MPALPSSRAMPLPIPLLPPVTIATRDERSGEVYVSTTAFVGALALNAAVELHKSKRLETIAVIAHFFILLQ